MTTLKQDMQKAEAAAIKVALIENNGSILITAKALGMPAATLSYKLEKNPALKAKAAALREKASGHSGSGRPRKTDENRTKKSVRAAWVRNGYSYAAAGRDLNLPASTVRLLIDRYKLTRPKSEPRATP